MLAQAGSLSFMSRNGTWRPTSRKSGAPDPSALTRPVAPKPRLSCMGRLRPFLMHFVPENVCLYTVHWSGQNPAENF